MIIPDCVMMGPANEKNEMDTVLFLSSQLGDGVKDGLRPAEIRVTGPVNLVTDIGLVSAQGLSYVSDHDVINAANSSIQFNSVCQRIARKRCAMKIPQVRPDNPFVSLKRYTIIQ